MTRLRLLALLPVLAAPLLLAAPAFADTTPADVASALRSDPVFVEPDAEHAKDVDADKVRSQVQSSSHQVFVAVLPQRAADKLGSARTVAIRVAELTPRSSVLVAFVGDELVAVAGPDTPFGQGEAQDLVSAASGSATDRLVEAVSAVQSVGSDSVGGGGNGSGNGGGDTSGGGSGALFPIIGLLAVGGGGAYVLSKRRRAKREMEGLRADVESLYNRLGSDIYTITCVYDLVAKQALSDSS